MIRLRRKSGGWGLLRPAKKRRRSGSDPSFYSHAGLKASAVSRFQSSSLAFQVKPRMSSPIPTQMIPAERVEKLIHIALGENVLLDADLAKLYG